LLNQYCVAPLPQHSTISVLTLDAISGTEHLRQKHETSEAKIFHVLNGMAFSLSICGDDLLY
jgi:hypothetical protein